MEKLYNCLKDESPEIKVDAEIAEKAVKPIKRIWRFLQNWDYSELFPCRWHSSMRV